MKQYIDKSALIAKIEGRIKELQNLSKENEKKFDSFQKMAIYLCIDECKVVLNILNTLEVKRFIAWLEKQVEQKSDDKIEPTDYNSIDPHFGKPIDKIEPKFKVGDWIINNDVYGDVPVKIKEIGNYLYLCERQDGVIIELNKDAVLKEFKHWDITDAADGNVLFHSDSASNGIFIFKKLLKCGFSEKVICYCDYDSEDGFCLGEHHTCCWADAKILHPATKEQHDLLFQKMKEAGYEWDAAKKQLEKIIDEKQIKKNLQDNSFRRMFEQKPAWSEEDDYNLQCMIAKVTSDIQKGNVGRNNELIDWLNSLKERMGG